MVASMWANTQIPGSTTEISYDFLGQPPTEKAMNDLDLMMISITRSRLQCPDLDAKFLRKCQEAFFTGMH